MKKKLKIILAVAFSVILLTGTFFLGFFTREWTLSKDARYAMNLIQKYNNYYLYEQSNVIDLIENEILDEYSTFYTKKEYEAVKKSAKGYGLGVGISFVTGTSVIADVLGNSSAEKQGVTVGGEVIAVNTGGGFITPTNKQEIPALIQNANENSQITLKVLYGSQEKIFNLVKQEYLRTFVTYKSNTGVYSYQTNANNKVERVKLSNLDISIPSKTAYIKYSSFNGRENGLNGSVGQMENALELFKSEQNETLILDLRNNGGGYLSIVNKLTAMLVPTSLNDKFLTLYSKNKHGDITNYYSEKSVFSNYQIKNLVIMLNEKSASASESLFGAIYDYSIKNNFNLKAVISSSTLNGQTVYKSYGKGIMQTTYENLDGSAVKLTSAKLYWPISNRCIHGVGITKSLNPSIIYEAEKSTALNLALSLN